ncbi:MAG: FGGY family carbohydrate kinase, partial [Acidobacteriota bacterium]|nr:FGGY family carbohydrate kinase [Acidobacteriota bacterium]
MTGKRLVAVIDQGSSSTKGAVVGRDGRRFDEITHPVALESSGLSVRHDARELAASVRAVLDPLIHRHEVAAIGLTCQRSTCLLWDRDSGRPLTPALSWQDTSQTETIERLSRHADRIAALTGLRLSPHYAAPKLLSLMDSLAGGRKRAEKGELVAGTLDAHLVRHLTGIDGTEPGHAGRTLLYDLERGAWSAELAGIFDIPTNALPPLHRSCGDWGRYRGVPLTAVAGDQQAALLGHGGWGEGVTAVHFGTGAFVLTSTGNRLLRHPNALTAALASTFTTSGFQIEASVNSAGSAVDWARRLGGESLDDWHERNLDADSLPFVLPAFRGVGAPWWRSDARAVVSGLSL